MNSEMHEQTGLNTSGNATRGRRVPHKPVFALLLALVLSVVLSACTLVPSVAGSSNPTATTTATTTASSGASVASSTTATATPVPATSPSAASPSSSAAATPSTNVDSASTPSSDVVSAVKQVIQKANQEQEQALAKNDPTLMQDTATPSYYNQLVQDLQSISASGVTSIHLSKLTWGSIQSQGSSTVQATTVEVWDVTFDSQGTLQQTDTNVYTLVKENGSWKIRSDQHPDTRTLQPPTGSSGTSPSPGLPSNPTTGANASVNWAGYAATGGTFTAVSADWTVPNVGTTTTPAADATWVGIGGMSSQDLIQAGTQAVVQGSQVTYSAWVETLPQAAQTVPLTVNAGDHISVSLAQQSSGVWGVTIKDLTSGNTYKTTVNYQSSLSSAEWIEESPSAGRRMLLPLDNFGKVSFSKASTVENGQTRTISQANGQPITMEVVSGQALAQTSALGNNGSSFTVSRTDVTAPQISPRSRQFRGFGG